MKRKSIHQSDEDSEIVNCGNDILEGLSDSGICEVSKEGEEYVFIEACDNWYTATLTKDEMLILIKQLQELINETNHKIKI